MKAALRAVRQGRKEINQSDLEESIEVVLAGFQRKEKTISLKEKEIVAYHEIGHALVAAKQTDQHLSIKLPSYRGRRERLVIRCRWILMNIT